MRKQMLFIVTRNLMEDGYDLHVGIKGEFSGKFSVLKSAMFEDVEEGVMPNDVPFTMSREDATRLVTELWNAGIRPVRHEDSSATVEALQSHIRDFREITSRLLDNLIGQRK